MHPDSKDMARLWDMVDSARAAIGYVEGMNFAEYCSDRKTLNAVERCMEIVGEAARHVSVEARNCLPEILWSSIVGLRNVIAHDYGEVLNEKVWIVCRERLPEPVAHLRIVDQIQPPHVEDS